MKTKKLGNFLKFFPLSEQNIMEKNCIDKLKKPGTAKVRVIAKAQKALKKFLKL